MKKLIYLSLALMMLSMTACSSDDDDNTTTNDITANGPTGTPHSRPTDWTQMQADDYDFGLSSMMITVGTDGIPAGVELNDGDLMAAFVNGECRAAASPQADSNGQTWFFLNIPSLMSDNDSKSLPVELRYYSTSRGAIYTAKSFEYIADGWKGSVVNGGFVPQWQ